MITVPTVLVLGAGASMGFEYPSGPALIRQIVRFLGPSADSRRAKDILARAGFGEDRTNPLREALVNCGRASVDALLEHREDLLDVGKAAIAYALMTKENKSKAKLFGDHESNWYMYLFDRLGSVGDWHDNKLTILTYNYDRSLEHFLFTAAKSSFKRSDTEIANAISALRIIHVHGRLDPLPHESNNGRRYGDKPTGGADIEHGAEGIKIIHEKQDEAGFLRLARKALASTSRICFLGFGYHEVNIARLRFSEVPTKIQAFGTAWGLEDGEKKFVRQMLGLGGRHVSFGGEDVGCLKYLKQKGILLP